LTADSPPQEVVAGTAPHRPAWILPLVLLLGLVHGLVYLFVFPPWQHYDEPSHLEYALLIAQRGSLPKSGDYDLAMRQEIASSMQATGFWRGQVAPPLNFWSQSPPGIGVDELVHPPLYYGLVALAELPFTHQSVETKLYVARLCSLGFYLMVLASAYGLVAEAFPRRRWLPGVVAAFLALLPPFADRMSSVNNDVGATAVTSALLWAAVILARRGLSLRRVLLVLLLAVLCIVTKSTALLIALVVVAVLVVLFLPKGLRRWLWLGVGCTCLAGVAVLLATRGQAANWYSVDPHGAPNRAETQTPLDSSSFLLSENGFSPKGLLQELAPNDGQALRGHTVTLGGWLRAGDDSDGLVTLSVDVGTEEHTLTVEATEDWEFHALTATIDLDARGVAAHIFLPGQPNAAKEVYLDGLILVDRAVLPGDRPAYVDAAARSAIWGGQAVTNLLRNGSAEDTWPGLPSWIGNRTLFRPPTARLFYSVWDWTRTHWVYPWELLTLLKSFWGGFGWNHLLLPSSVFYPLGILTILGLAGAILAWFRSLGGKRLPDTRQERVWLVLLSAVLVGWAMAIVRIHPVFVTMRIYWPVARYADVVIVPTATLLCVGWAELVPPRLGHVAAWVGLLGLLCLDLVSLGTLILPYYYG
jgi:hypothetical protein